MASRVEMWPLARLVPYARNSRTHSPEQIAQIAASIMEFGFTQPILVDENTGKILAGHARLDAAKSLSLKEAPVVPLGHLTEAQQRAYIIADNKLALNAGWDEGMLRLELDELVKDASIDLGVIGFSEKELKALMDDSGDREEGETDADEAPKAEEKAVARRGDLWLLGNHRLLCGDSTDPDDVALLLGGERAQLILTDPPYNVNYFHSARERREARISGKREKLHDVIQQDDVSPEEFQDFIDATMAVYAAVLEPTGSMYCFFPLSRHTAFEAAIEQAGMEIRCHIIWAKNHFVLTFNRYKQQHEGILYCHLKGQTDVWYGDNTQSTLWHEKKPLASREHPTMKPVELLERALVNSTKRRELVFDFFGGSGSTLIACERMGRYCRTIEIEPVYCDVILRRWARHTKRQPIHRDSGATFLEIERERLSSEANEPPVSDAGGSDNKPERPQEETLLETT